jgi:hypothetical protein
MDSTTFLTPTKSYKKKKRCNWTELASTPLFMRRQNLVSISEVGVEVKVKVEEVAKLLWRRESDLHRHTSPQRPSKRQAAESRLKHATTSLGGLSEVYSISTI